MHRLFLLDGMALVYRAHFAFIRSPIFTTDGFNTSAIVGFTNAAAIIIAGVAIITVAKTVKPVARSALSKAEGPAAPAAVPLTQDSR